MIKTIFKNRLMVSAIIGVLSYFALYLIFPVFWVNVAWSAAVMVFGFLVAVTWFGDALYVLKKGIPHGEQLAVIGVFLIGLGASYGGFYGVAWNVLGRPEHWAQWPFVSIGRGTTSVGLLLLLISPGATKEGLSLPPKWAIVGTALGLVLIGYVLGVVTSNPMIRGSL